MFSLKEKLKGPFLSHTYLEHFRRTLAKREWRVAERNNLALIASYKTPPVRSLELMVLSTESCSPWRRCPPPRSCAWADASGKKKNKFILLSYSHLCLLSILLRSSGLLRANGCPMTEKRHLPDTGPRPHCVFHSCSEIAGI